MQSLLRRSVFISRFAKCYLFASTPQAFTSKVMTPKNSSWSKLDILSCTSHAGSTALPPISVAELESTLGPLSSLPTLPPPAPVVLVVSGPSGVGKDAVIRRLQEKRPDLYFVVTATSRPMRAGEVEGSDYFFVRKSQFEEWIAAGDELLEWALVYGEYKGIPRRQVEDALQRGTDVILRIDVQGAATVGRLMPDVVTVFLVAESELELVERLVSRKTEPLDKMLLRVQTARRELNNVNKFDYVIVNQDGELERTVSELEAILQAEKAKASRRLKKSSV